MAPPDLDGRRDVVGAVGVGVERHRVAERLPRHPDEGVVAARRLRVVPHAPAETELQGLRPVLLDDPPEVVELLLGRVARGGCSPGRRRSRAAARRPRRSPSERPDTCPSRSRTASSTEATRRPEGQAPATCSSTRGRRRRRRARRARGRPCPAKNGATRWTRIGPGALQAPGRGPRPGRSAPSADRTRTRKNRPFRSSSTDERMTGRGTSSFRRTGAPCASRRRRARSPSPAPARRSAGGSRGERTGRRGPPQEAAPGESSVRPVGHCASLPLLALPVDGPDGDGRPGLPELRRPDSVAGGGTRRHGGAAPLIARSLAPGAGRPP